MIRVRSRSAAASGRLERAMGKVVPSIVLDSVSHVVYKMQDRISEEMNSMRLNSHPSGRHFLQIPGPTNVPDRFFARWTIRRSTIAAGIQRAGQEGAAQRAAGFPDKATGYRLSRIRHGSLGSGLVNTLSPATWC
jgi:hypothetical protein